MRPLLLVILLVFFNYSYGFLIPGFPRGKLIRDYREKFLYPEIADIDCSFVKTNYTTAKVDNFDPNSTETWQQVRYV